MDKNDQSELYSSKLIITLRYISNNEIIFFYSLSTHWNG